MIAQQKRIIILGVAAIFVIILVIAGVSRTPQPDPVTAVETQNQSGEATTSAPITADTVDSDDAASLEASAYFGTCAMPGGGLMYGTVMDVNGDPAASENVRLRNNTSGEILTFNTKASACRFESAQ